MPDTLIVDRQTVFLKPQILPPGGGIKQPGLCRLKGRVTIFLKPEH